MNDLVSKGENKVEICDSETVETEQASNENNAENHEDSGPKPAQKYSLQILLSPNQVWI